MRRVLLALILGLILAFSLGISSALALVTLAPFQPGEELYASLQQPLEQALVLVTPGQARKALRLLDISAHRVRDLKELAGTPRESLALGELDASLSLAVQAMAVTPQTAAPLLHAKLSALLLDLEKTLPGVRPPAGWSPEKWQAFLAWEMAISQKSMRSTLVLADLASPGSQRIQAAQMPEKALAAPTVTPTPAVVAGRMVWFQVGSPGQLHDFYPLTGAHAALDCMACHPTGTYAGTTATCQGCHKAPANHFPGECTTCHNTTAWKPAFFDHKSDLAKNCLWCHAGDKPANHYPGMCSACHSTTAWKPAHFDHQVAGATDCLSCHAGDKPVGHFSGQCGACHSTSAWLPAHFNHSAAGATDCTSCHAKDKPAGHYNGQCSACHTTNAWKPASFNHAVAGATDCQACHARPANHFDGQCSMCHNTSTWAGATFNHTFPTSHGGANGQCSTCHPGGTGSWTCSGCHSQADMDAKHAQVPGYSGNCIACHPTGNNPGN